MNSSKSFLLIPLFGLATICLQNCKDKESSKPAAPLPVVNFTNLAEKITALSAATGGFVASEGTAPVTERGVCFGKNSLPTINSNYFTVNGFGLGEFASVMAGLDAETMYFARAYATNSNGTAYGPEITFTTLTATDPVADVDDNVYGTVRIGLQTWLSENLRTTHYQNGDPIPTHLRNEEWKNTTTGACANYDEDSTNYNATYGKLYNWFAVMDNRKLCPVGWHIPSSSEWITLSDFLGGAFSAGGRMKAVSELWVAPNLDATNQSGFGGLPAGYRSDDGTFYGIGEACYLWTSGDGGSGAPSYKKIQTANAYLSSGTQSGQNAYTVRCVQD